MEREDDVNQELKDIIPDFPKRKNEGAPDGYFETFPDKLMARWKQDSSTKVKRLPRRLIQIAAIVTGLLIGGWWLITSNESVSNEPISALEAYLYVHENIDDFEDLIEVQLEPLDITPIEIPQSEIEKYLMEELEGTNPEDLY